MVDRWAIIEICTNDRGASIESDAPAEIIIRYRVGSGEFGTSKPQTRTPRKGVGRAEIITIMERTRDEMIAIYRDAKAKRVLSSPIRSIKLDSLGKSLGSVALLLRNGCFCEILTLALSSLNWPHLTGGAVHPFDENWSGNKPADRDRRADQNPEQERCDQDRKGIL